MNVLHKGYWLGQSVSYVPKDAMFHIEHFFQINECGFEVSILSDPAVQYCFFFYEHEHQRALLNTAVKICTHLNKKLILIHNGLPADAVLNSDAIFSRYNLHDDNILPWIEQLSTQLFCCFSSLSDEQVDPSQHAHCYGKNVSSDLAEILLYIEKNLAATIREEDVAEYCHYSISYFSKVFHHAIGMTFRDYVIHKRMELAKKLLKEDKKTKVAFIAFQCGYKDVSYFTRIFKKKVGITPANYRHLA